MRARLLVVDDEELNREIIREYLEDEDCDLFEAESGEQALVMLETGDFDAVLLDRMMPGIDGIEVLQRMKKNPRLSELPVVFQTAAAAADQLAEGLRLGAYYYLTKPYHRDALAAVVQSALDLGRQRRELRAKVAAYSGVMHMVEDAHYRYRTLEEGQALAAALATVCAEPERAAMGLVELLVNAVEHGNLGIDFEEKAKLLSAGQWQSETTRRLQLPENVDKFVDVHAYRTDDEIVVLIRDQGNGFDWDKFLTLDESRAFFPNGRGIALARQIAFRSVEYRGCGNEVEVRITAGSGAGVPITAARVGVNENQQAVVA
jgi:CheY-like chemotaxis protein/anti-sigma regulatory factor (Ser/Thr protein kinase)